MKKTKNLNKIRFVSILSVLTLIITLVAINYNSQQLLQGKLPPLQQALKPSSKIEKTVPQAKVADTKPKTHVEIDANGKTHTIDNETGKEIEYNEDSAQDSYIPCQKGITENNKKIWSYCGQGIDFSIYYSSLGSDGNRAESTSDITYFPTLGGADYLYTWYSPNAHFTASGMKDLNFIKKIKDIGVTDSTTGTDGRVYFVGKAYKKGSTSPTQLQFTLDQTGWRLYIGFVGEGATQTSGNSTQGTGHITYPSLTLNQIEKIEIPLKNNEIIRFENFGNSPFTDEHPDVIFATSEHSQGTGKVGN